MTGDFSEPELVIVDNFLACPMELMTELRDGVTWDTRLRARLTASFGVSYDYSGMTYPETAMQPGLIPICDELSRRFGHLPTNCLVNYYLDGDSSLGFHCDITEELLPGSWISVVSLGDTRSIVFRRKDKKEREIKFPLASGSLLHMSQGTQDEWLHAIPKEPGAGARMSLTFRCIVRN